jgi:hypothetical protein
MTPVVGHDPTSSSIVSTTTASEGFVTLTDFHTQIVHEAHELIGNRSAASRNMAFLGVPSHLVEGSHVDAYAILEMSHCGGDCMMAAARCEWNALFARILDNLDHVVLTTWIDNS